MPGTSHSVNQILDRAVSAITAGQEALVAALDHIEAAIYVTDKVGTITYFNTACVTLAGRTPRIGHDKWCVTWQIYTPEGEFLPHDHCPMAVAINEQRPIRGVEAVARRPDGKWVSFIPYPTPLFDRAGMFIGAVNLLLDVTEARKPNYLRGQAAKCRRLGAGIDDRRVVDALASMAVQYDDQAARMERFH